MALNSCKAVSRLSTISARRGQVLRVLQAFVLEPKDIQAALISLDQFIIAKGMEAVSLGPFPAIIRVIALDEVLQILVLERIGL